MTPEEKMHSKMRRYITYPGFSQAQQYAAQQAKKPIFKITSLQATIGTPRTAMSP